MSDEKQDFGDRSTIVGCSKGQFTEEVKANREKVHFEDVILCAQPVGSGDVVRIQTACRLATLPSETYGATHHPTTRSSTTACVRLDH
ncbi:hypothetical protein ETAA8_36620 [Anatilimnocola aggregata]|uniref:Uncharacterized protein n=1 Tax=Anatilimnocola aggregata TaxID=2528021 RepID=A0A517YE97_9BACT|nr:hypothetical protein ETAA8_36620 [Anatilimnocola aggregata]